MSATPTEYDVLIVGGGPAGCAAALHGRRLGLRTRLVDRAGAGSPRGCPAWVGPAAAKWLDDAGVKLTKVGQKFAGLRLWAWDFGKHAAVPGADCGGWIVDPPALRAALLAAVRAAKIEIQRPATVTRLTVGERNTRIELSDGQVQAARVVIVAAGAGSELVAQLSLAGGSPQPVQAAGAQATFESASSAATGLEVVLGAAREFKLATVARARGRVCVTLLTYEAGTPAGEQLGALLTAGQKAGAIPAGAKPSIRAEIGRASCRERV